jgi:polysaccharide biosynthesis/export protein
MKCLAVLYALCLAATPLMAEPIGATSSIAAPAPVRVGGILDIRVAGEPTLSKGYLVDAAGRITLDMIGQIEVAGQTPDQIAETLRTRLKEYLKQPVVTVAMVTPLQQDVLVTGAVLRPNPVRLRPGDGLLEALAAVGGLGPNADAAHATLVRRGQAQPLPLNIDLLLKGDLSKNTPLSDGDIIQVPAREIATYRVVGEVKVPGLKPLDGSTRVRDAILSAGSLTNRADQSRITLMRKDQTAPIVIDLDKVMAGETSANVLVEPGDVLTVGSQMTVQVAGEVRTTGERALRNGATLMEAILFSGGFSPVADRSAIEITHKDGTVEKSSLAEVTGVVGGPALRPGDLVIVRSSKPQFVTLFGAVRNNAALRYESGMKITEALMAAGLSENSNWKQIRVLRGGDGPDRKILMFNLEAYLKAPQTQNLALEPGDQIFVETHRAGTTVLRHLIDVLPLANLFFLFR